MEVHMKRLEIDFEGRTVLITGAATGIGRATALAFAAARAAVVIGDRRSACGSHGERDRCCRRQSRIREDGRVRQRLAIAMVDELEQRAHSRQRFTVAY
jgi:NAD(P)-dependent dehydrogenase (short-subunit alcohol dehydrogenase family)